MLSAMLLFLLGGAALAQLPAGPDLNLGRTHRGSEILVALGANLPAVAKAYGMTDQELTNLCLRDRDIRADKTGKLFYACEGAVANAPTATNGGTNALLTYPSSQTFLLHSKPGLSRVLYLDFNGHTTSGTSWNSAYTAGAAFTSPAYDTDGNPGSFSTTELANIQQIWKRVSEDYSAWDVNVTTEEPPLESLRKTTSTDTAYGIRMVIGGSSNDWLRAGAGGVAYLGSFSWNSDTPAFVFPAQLSNGNPKYVAEAASHEAGHTVSLNHDGKTDGTEYYQGHNGWAPIMGVSYYANISQFSRGEYGLANNTQDDLTVINGHIPRSVDLAGNDILTAVPLSGTSVSVTGIIESRTDADIFKINAGNGTLNISAAPASPDANLDIQLSLYNGAGNLVTTVDPAGMAATLSTSVTSGTYYIAVDGVGVGTASTGYTDYASIGQYSLTGTVPSPVGQPPVAVVSNSAPLTGLAPLTVQFSSAGSSDPEGSALTYDWDFGDGTSSTDANPAHLYTLAGTYTASLVVFDSTGLSGSASATVTVQSLGSIIYVSSISMSKTVSKRGTEATATVTVRDASGAVKPNVTVTGKWSGLTTTTSSGNTNSSGQVALKSGFSKGTGTFTFTITGLTLSGATYDPARNVVSSGSIVK
jgi:PKD repeat protein